MKELYIAPEVKRLAFLPQENLATQGGDFDDLLEAGQEGGGGSLFPGGNSPESGNVNLPNL